MRETESAGFLREQAEKCRRLAGTVNDTKAIASLRKLAAHYQERAASVRKTRPQFPAQKPRRPSASVRFPPILGAIRRLKRATKRTGPPTRSPQGFPRRANPLQNMRKYCPRRGCLVRVPNRKRKNGTLSHGRRLDRIYAHFSPSVRVHDFEDRPS